MKKNRNEELQSRREFFKNAVKSVLPILGTIVLSSTTVLAKIMKHLLDVKVVVIRLVLEDVTDASTHVLVHARMHVQDVSTHVTILVRTHAKH